MASTIYTANNKIFSLFDLPNNKFFVIINNSFNNKIFNSILAREGSIVNASEKLNISFASMYNWKKNKQYPLKYIYSIFDLINYNPKRLEKNIVGLKSGFNLGANGGGLSKTIYPKFPIFLSKELTRIISHTFGDGCLSVNKKGHVTLTYYNQNKFLRDSFKKDIISIFGKVYIKEGINKTTPYVRVPAPIAFIFLTKINSFNSKFCRVPDFIKRAKISIKIEFLKAFFDDEAHVRYNPPHRRIELTLCNKLFLKDVKEMLYVLNIPSTKIYSKFYNGFHAYSFYIVNRSNIQNFYNKIGFNHPQKFKKLEKMVKNPSRETCLFKENEKKILNFIEKGINTSSSLIENIKRKRVTINLLLNKLEKQGKVYRKEIRKLKNGREIVWDIK